MCVSGEVTREPGYVAKICYTRLNTFATVWSWFGNFFEFFTAYPRKT